MLFLSLHRKRFFDIPACQASFYQTDEWKDTDFIGQLFTGAGLMLLCNADTGEYLYGAGLLVGIGVGFSIGQFLRMMILLPLHCERGTGYHTYQLLWETGVMLGIWISQYVRQAGNNNPYQVALGICVIGFLLYQVYIHRYFTKHYQTN